MLEGVKQGLLPKLKHAERNLHDLLTPPQDSTDPHWHFAMHSTSDAVRVLVNDVACTTSSQIAVEHEITSSKASRIIIALHLATLVFNNEAVLQVAREGEWPFRKLGQS